MAKTSVVRMFEKALGKPLVDNPRSRSTAKVVLSNRPRASK